MDIADIVLALGERYSRALANPEMVSRAIDEHKIGNSSDAAYVATLFEKRAGLTPVSPGNCDELRLGNPRLRTTYPDERRRALTKRMLDQADVLAKGLGPIMEAAIKFELAKVELTEERNRDRQFADAEHARRELGIYVEVVSVVDRLYNDYGVTRRHYPCATDEQVRDIAAILLRKPAHEVPVKKRRVCQEAADR